MTIRDLLVLNLTLQLFDGFFLSAFLARFRLSKPVGCNSNIGVECCLGIALQQSDCVFY